MGRWSSEHEPGRRTGGGLLGWRGLGRRSSASPAAEYSTDAGWAGGRSYTGSSPAGGRARWHTVPSRAGSAGGRTASSSRLGWQSGSRATGTAGGLPAERKPRPGVRSAPCQVRASRPLEAQCGAGGGAEGPAAGYHSARTSSSTMELGAVGSESEGSQASFRKRGISSVLPTSHRRSRTPPHRPLLRGLS